MWLKVIAIASISVHRQTPPLAESLATTASSATCWADTWAYCCCSAEPPSAHNHYDREQRGVQASKGGVQAINHSWCLQTYLSNRIMTATIDKNKFETYQSSRTAIRCGHAYQHPNLQRWSHSSNQLPSEFFCQCCLDYQPGSTLVSGRCGRRPQAPPSRLQLEETSAPRICARSGRVPFPKTQI